MTTGKGTETFISSYSLTRYDPVEYPFSVKGRYSRDDLETSLLIVSPLLTGSRLSDPRPSVSRIETPAGSGLGSEETGGNRENIVLLLGGK